MCHQGQNLLDKGSMTIALSYTNCFVFVFSAATREFRVSDVLLQQVIESEEMNWGEKQSKLLITVIAFKLITKIFQIISSDFHL